NGNGPVDFTAAARGFARMRAHSPANAGQRIRLARESVGLFESALGNQANVASGVGVGRAGHHAGEVCVQPIPIDLLVFESFQHSRSFKFCTAAENSFWFDVRAGVRTTEERCPKRTAPCHTDGPALTLSG